MEPTDKWGHRFDNRDVNLKITKRSLENFLGQLINAGITADTDPRLLPFLRQTNTNGLMFFVMDLVLALILYFTVPTHEISIALCISGVLFALSSVGLNHLGFTSLSRLSTAAIGTSIISACSVFLGSKVNPEATLLIGAILPFTQFHLGEKFKILISLLYPLMMTYVLKAYQFDFIKPANIDPGNIITISFVFYAFPYISVAFNTFYAVNQLHKKAEELKQSENHLSTIFSALSHDLGTPLQLISFLSYQAEKSGTMSAPDIHRLKNSTDRVKGIFNKLRQIAFLNGGKIPVQISPHNLMPIIETAIRNLDETLGTKKLKVTLANLSTYDVLCSPMDRDLFLHQVLNNILTNAIKFSYPGGEIKIELHNGENPGRLKLLISDQGKGINQSDQEKLFSWRAATTTVGTAGEKGTGLGLPLVKTFTSCMNMTLDLVSRSKQEYPEDHGTTITIGMKRCLPFEERLVNDSSEPNS